MSLWGTMHGSAIAMMTQTTGMNAIGENIANVSTTGYKRVEANFKTLLNETDVTADYYTATPAVRRMNTVQGNILATGRATDLAINGRGFFITNTALDGGGDTRFTRDGGFHTRANDVDGDGVADSQLVSAQGHALMGWAANSDGTFTETGSLTALEPVVINNQATAAGSATSSVTMHANVQSSAADTQPIHMPIYDNNFTTKTVTANWVPSNDGSNTWTLNFDMAAAEGTVTSPAAGATTFTFDGLGQLPSTTAPVSVSVTWADATTSTFTVDVANVTQLAGPTQVNSLVQDGRRDGQLFSTHWNAEGVLTYTYTNGVVKPAYKIPLATFPAENQLKALSGNTFIQTEEAGELTVSAAGAVGGLARFEGGSVETSNVDLADEFTKMITTQKAYTFNATVFRTSDEMIQLAVDMK